MQDIIDSFSATIRRAAGNKSPLRIRGGGTKDFYGGPLLGEVLSITPYSGISFYDPTELVITARAGTPLAQVENALREHGQMLAFEPPHFGEAATMGGCIAAGLSGPRRAYAGAVRDFVLGVRMLDGRGNNLHFGGQVMKNVAGYDVSRLLTGSLGTLGVILEVSLKLLPTPKAEKTLRLEMDEARAIRVMNEWGGKPLPISAVCHEGNTLSVRISGAESAVRAAMAKIGGNEAADGEAFWRNVKEQTLEFFRPPGPLWRISVRSTAAPLNLPGKQLIEWGGALRWVKAEADAGAVREKATAAGGHAALFRGGKNGVFHPLAPGLMQIHRRLKENFDPAGIFNPGRMYEGL